MITVLALPVDVFTVTENVAHEYEKIGARVYVRKTLTNGVEGAQYFVDRECPKCHAPVERAGYCDTCLPIR